MKDLLIKTLENQRVGKTNDLTLADLPMPETLLNNVEMAEEIITRLQNKESVLVVGDYDCDGIVATTVLVDFLKAVGLDETLNYIIPSRLVDGYGLSSTIIDYAIEKETDVIITVDNGISAVDAIAQANAAGITVLITDHHTVPAVIPDAHLIVNPQMAGETFPYKSISGATVTWYVCAQINTLLGKPVKMADWLDLVALTVLSDVMPLDHINNAILKFGIKQIKREHRQIYAHTWDMWKMPVLTETDISFGLVPKINAIGRIADANIGVQMLLSDDPVEVRNIYEEITRVNQARKSMTKVATDEADKIVNESSKIAVIQGSFHEGIVGIIAGRIAEKYQVPAFVFSFNEEKGVWKGSARTSGKINLYELIFSVSEHVHVFGGHAGAAGLAVKPECWDAFNQAINAKCDEIDPADFLPTTPPPIQCDINKIDMSTVELMDGFRPFGQGNPEPSFQGRTKISGITNLGKTGDHIKITLANHNEVLFFFVSPDFKKEAEQALMMGNEITFNFQVGRKYHAYRKEESISFMGKELAAWEK